MASINHSTFPYKAEKINYIKRKNIFKREPYSLQIDNISFNCQRLGLTKRKILSIMERIKHIYDQEINPIYF